MDELQALYDVYMQNGILGQGTTFEQFSSANDVQLESLYNQGLSARLLSQQTDLDTFKSAWAVKKKTVRILYRRLAYRSNKKLLKTQLQLSNNHNKRGQVLAQI